MSPASSADTGTRIETDSMGEIAVPADRARRAQLKEEAAELELVGD